MATSLEKLMDFIDPPKKRKIFALLLFREYSAPHLADIVDASPQYTNEVLKQLSYMDVVEKVEAKGAREFKVSNDYLRDIIDKIIEKANLPEREDLSDRHLIAYLRNPISLFLSTRKKKLIDLFSESMKEKSSGLNFLKKFISDSVSDFSNPIEGIIMLPVNLTLFPFFSSVFDTKKEFDQLEFSKNLVNSFKEDKLYGKLDLNEKELKEHLKEFVELVERFQQKE